MAGEQIMDALFGGLKRVGETGLDLGKTVASLPVNVVSAIPDFFKDPEVFMSGDAPGAVAAILSPDYRKQQRAALDAKAAIDDFNMKEKGFRLWKDLIFGAPTDTAQGETRKALEEQGLMVPQGILNAAKSQRQAARAAAAEAGLPAAATNIADVDMGQRAALERFNTDNRLTEIGATGTETRKNQASAFGYDQRLEELRNRNQMGRIGYQGEVDASLKGYGASVEDWLDKRRFERTNEQSRYEEDLRRGGVVSDEQVKGYYEKTGDKRRGRLSRRLERTRGGQDRLTNYEKGQQEAEADYWRHQYKLAEGDQARESSANLELLRRESQLGAIGARGEQDRQTAGVRAEYAAGLEGLKQQGRLDLADAVQSGRLTLQDAKQKASLDLEAVRQSGRLDVVGARGEQARMTNDQRAEQQKGLEQLKQAGRMDLAAAVQEDRLDLQTAKAFAGIQQIEARGEQARETVAARREGAKETALDNAGNAQAFLRQAIDGGALKGMKLADRKRVRAALNAGGQVAVETAKRLASTIGAEKGGTNISIVNPGPVVNDLRKEIDAGNLSLATLDDIEALAANDPDVFSTQETAAALADRVAEKFGVTLPVVGTSNDRRQQAVSLVEMAFNQYMLLIGGTTVAEPLRKALRETYVNADDSAPTIIAKIGAIRQSTSNALRIREQQLQGYLTPQAAQARLRENVGKFHKDLADLDAESGRDVGGKMTAPLSEDEKARMRAVGINPDEVTQ